MELAQVTAAQMRPQNQLRFEPKTFDARVLRRDRNKAVVRKVGHVVAVALLKAGNTLLALSKTHEQSVMR